ncbi:hypothetical protein HUU53_01185 [Candidatus Micrarchaeota archaeon]|nr:hypothetical protein [Candidatus Micrarchaeota archaeon]
MKVINEAQNALYDRKEVEAEFDSTKGTTTRQHALQELKTKYGENIVIVSINQSSGSKKCTVMARVYSDKAKMEKLEPAYRFKRSEPKEAKK